ncbi:MAG TPA: zinc metalloprotease, partial [Aliicoccus persicus]|nr:zinc metalloprotease [Aliicoccus persicus]
ETLLEVETLDREQIESLFNDGVLPERVYESDADKEEEIGKSYEDVKKDLHEDEADPDEDDEMSEETEVETETTNLPEDATHEPNEVDAPGEENEQDESNRKD